MDCSVRYIKGSSCAKMRFKCSSFNVHNRDGRRCRKGDKLFVGKKVYCRTRAPKVFTSGNPKVRIYQLLGRVLHSFISQVRFVSNARKNGAGARCTMTCIETPPGTVVDN